MTESYYEDSDILAEYLLFHYGSDKEILPWEFGPINSTQFPERIAHTFAPHYPLSSVTSALRALDIGCAVGRSSFELSRYVDEVVGIDFSHSFIRAAGRLQEQGQLEYNYKIQGKIYHSAIAKVPPSLERGKVHFEQGDAMRLDPEILGRFDLILASNLICRLPAPATFLRSLSSLMNPGGILVLSSPFTWLDDFTPEEAWLGGKTSALSAFDAIKETLNHSFTLLETRELPMLIREHERKFQWTVCHGSVWKMKSV